MITVNKNWIRLIGIVGCTVWMASCKQAPDAGVKSSYAVMQIEPTDKELSSSYSATIRGRQDIDIYPQVSGTIEKLCVTEGQKVRRGSGPRRYKHRRTDLQEQQGTVCAESRFRI